MAARRKSTRQRIELTDPRGIRALAHPARLAVLEELFSGRVATATELAALTDLSPSAMSYHLRALEKWGLVVRDEPTGDGRERPWRAAADDFQIGASSTTRAGVAANTLLLAQMLETQRRDLAAYFEHEQDLPEEWRQGNVDNAVLTLTAEEVEALKNELGAAIDRFRRRRADQVENGRRVRVAFVVVPLVD
ncbi:MAG TPA: helix-turn-helix domain-containing protein [Actinopolymorphaceae bacterium]